MTIIETYPVSNGWQYRVYLGGELARWKPERVIGGWGPTESAAEKRARESLDDVAEVGDSLMVQKRHNANSTDVFEGLEKKAGWYISMYDLGESGDKYVASPFTEGPSDGA